MSELDSRTGPAATSTTTAAAVEPAVAALTAQVDALGDVDLDELAAEDQADRLLSLLAAQERLTAAVARAVRHFEVHGTAVWRGRDAAYNVANWIATRTGTSKAEAGRRRRLGFKLARMPRTAAAFAGGEITEGHARVLARGITPRTEAAFLRDEAMLLDWARTRDADTLAREMTLWLQAADPDGPDPATDTTRDRFHAARTLDGRVVGDFDLSADRGAAVLAAVDEKNDELFHRDQRNREVDPTDRGLDRRASNRRAEALAELIALGAAAPANTARRQPSFTVLIDPHTIADSSDPTGASGVDGADEGTDPEPAFPEVRELLDRTIVPLSLVRLWRCDCHIARAVMEALGEDLDLGREQRTANRAQRRALAIRDGGCAVPGCDRPPAWCDAHHILWWHRDHGPTDICNLCLLCRWHHRRVHTGELTVKMVDGHPRFWNAYNQELTDPRPPRGRPPHGGPPGPDPPGADPPGADPPGADPPTPRAA